MLLVRARPLTLLTCVAAVVDGVVVGTALWAIVGEVSDTYEWLMNSVRTSRAKER